MSLVQAHDVFIPSRAIPSQASIEGWQLRFYPHALAGLGFPVARLLDPSGHAVKDWAYTPSIGEVEEVWREERE